jgi:hypothetical protein
VIKLVLSIDRAGGCRCDSYDKHDRRGRNLDDSPHRMLGWQQRHAQRRKSERRTNV